MSATVRPGPLGSPGDKEPGARSERTAKWNRLLQLEAELGDTADYAGTAALAAHTSVSRGA